MNKKLSKYIDHTLLKADATPEKIIELCQQAKEYDFASVCVNSCYVPLCVKELSDCSVNVCTVIGFPLGAASTASKAFETKQAYEDGADEFDMVINIGELKAGNDAYVENDIRAVVEAAQGRTVKVIIETCLLKDQEKVKACQLSLKAGAHFVKTSTGFSTAGAKVEDVKLMRQTVGDQCQVKAAGGIHSYQEAMAMIEAGADRLGCSAGVAIIAGAVQK